MTAWAGKVIMGSPMAHRAVVITLMQEAPVGVRSKETPNAKFDIRGNF